MARPKSNTTNITGPIPDALYAAIDDARWGLKLEMKSVVTQAITEWAERHGVTAAAQATQAAAAAQATQPAAEASAAPGEAPAAPDAAPASAHPSRKR